MLIFINFLDDILKQFTIVGSPKEQQARKHKEHKYFPWGNHNGENPTNFLNIELTQDSVKPQDNFSSLSLA